MVNHSWSSEKLIHPLVHYPTQYSHGKSWEEKISSFKVGRIQKKKKSYIHYILHTSNVLF